MAKITVTTLKKGLEAYGLESDSKKVKELEKLLDEHLSTLELGYECPECKKDIPDVEICPYCGESFEEDGGEEDQTEEETTENEEGTEDEEQSEAVDDETAEEIAENLSKEDKGKDKNKDKGKAGKDKAAEKPDKNDKAGKKEDKPKSDKPKDEEKAKSGAGRPSGKSKGTEAKEEEFDKLVAAINEVVGEDFERRERKTGITYVQGGKRLMKAVKTGKTLSIEFNVEIKSDEDGLTKYTEEEAKAKHLGSTRAVYALGDQATAVKLVKAALKAFK